jgi:hypothetical protein
LMVVLSITKETELNFFKEPLFSVLLLEQEKNTIRKRKKAGIFMESTDRFHSH